MKAWGERRRLPGSDLAFWVVAGVLLASIFPFSSLQAATSPVPKVGNCYLIPESEASSPLARTKQSKCGKVHNAETYKVGKWDGSNNPLKLSEIDRRGLIDLICSATLPQNEYFNFWTYKLPSASQWKAGFRFVRCDAMLLKSESETVTFQSWKGKKLKSN
jgi:hypothetical protein